MLFNGAPTTQAVRLVVNHRFRSPPATGHPMCLKTDFLVSLPYPVPAVTQKGASREVCSFYVHLLLLVS